MLKVLKSHLICVKYLILRLDMFKMYENSCKMYEILCKMFEMLKSPLKRKKKKIKMSKISFNTFSLIPFSMRLCPTFTK